jgi:hypothetical protein
MGADDERKPIYQGTDRRGAEGGRGRREDEGPVANMGYRMHPSTTGRPKYNHAKTDIDRVAHARKGEGLQDVKSFVRDLTMLWSRLPTDSMNSSWRIYPG